MNETEAVLKYLEGNDVASLAGLTESLGLSESTARKALKALKRRGLCTGLGLDNTTVYLGS